MSCSPICSIGARGRHCADRDGQRVGANNRPLRVPEPRIVANHLSPELDVLAKQLKAAGKKLSEESEQQDFISAHDRLLGLAGELENVAHPGASRAPCIGSSPTKAAAAFRALTLAAAPVDIGPAMREQLFDKVPTVIMTSATLSVGGATASSEPGRPRPRAKTSSAANAAPIAAPDHDQPIRFLQIPRRPHAMR